MRKGDVSFMMWLVLGVMVLVALIIVIISLQGKGMNIFGTIRDAT